MRVGRNFGSLLAIVLSSDHMVCWVANVNRNSTWMSILMTTPTSQQVGHESGNSDVCWRRKHFQHDIYIVRYKCEQKWNVNVTWRLNNMMILIKYFAYQTVNIMNSSLTCMQNITRAWMLLVDCINFGQGSFRWGTLECSQHNMRLICDSASKSVTQNSLVLVKYGVAEK